ncbi:hypothetical protein L2E82_39770 [Cichorium intybus]|uniref:Uncharacterized protein n=1 Tax=Cichorium intybus TaxID=13427 RepID=A0ACB9AIL8_CICIN|nr:hypothetical protein L2E82_39770 [Cichorium intybus]
MDLTGSLDPCVEVKLKIADHNYNSSELEKELLLDDEDENTVSPSPTSSSYSSCASSSASPATRICPKQLLSDSAVAIADGKSDSVEEILLLHPRHYRPMIMARLHRLLLPVTEV